MPYRIGHQQSPDGGLGQRAVGSLQQIGRNAGYKDEQKRKSHELKTESGKVWRAQRQDEKQDCNQQRRGVAEVARPRPAGIRD